MIARLFLLGAVAALGLACTETSPPSPSGPFFGLTPTATPQRLPFASSLDEYNAVWNAAGDAFFFTVNTPQRSFMMESYLQPDGRWSTPTAMPFSAAEHPDYDPFLSFDEQRLYFSSRRPVDPDVRRSHVWYVDRVGERGWSEPVRVPLSDRTDLYTSLSRAGELYFNSWPGGGISRGIPSPEGYAVEALPEPINGHGRVADPYISPDGDYLIFRGYGEDSLGRGDLFISFFVDGAWTPRQNLGPTINSERHEMCTWVSADGRWFTFASARIDEPYEVADYPALVEKHHGADNGQLDLYAISADFIEALRPTS